MLTKMANIRGVSIVLTLILGLSSGQEDPRVTMMDRQSLHEYSLAKCSDGSTAAYYTDKDLTGVNAKVMIFFDNSVDSFSNPIQPCTSVDECVDICESHPQACASPVQATKLQRDGVWSRERQNNPFADYFKIYLPSCSLDDFSGAKGPLFGSRGGKIFFHGRHIFSSLLRDLVAKYGIDQAENIVLVGTGSGARGVGHGCDYLSEAIATVNDKASVKCVLDGPDLIPFWLNDAIAQQRCEATGQEAIIEETTKDLWGRTDDESCVRDLENELNDTALSTTCGMFSQYWKHVKTPMFIIASQFNQPDFNRITCNVSKDDEDYFTYDTLWKQGIMTMIQVMSLQQPANGWFIPNCLDQTLFFADESIEQRRNVQIPLFVTGEDKNLLQVLNNWLTKGIEDDEYQAIDQLGLPQEACSSELQSQRSQPLKKKKGDRSKSARQRIVPLDPLDDVPLPKGFPDGPPPKPSDPLEELFSEDPFSTDRLLGKDLFGALRQQNSNNQRKNQRNKNGDLKKNDRMRLKPGDIADLLPSGLRTDSELVLGAELLRRKLEQQRRRRPSDNDYYSNNNNNNNDYDFLYYLQNNAARRRRPDATLEATMKKYRNRFRMPTDLLYYRYNLYRQPNRQSGTDAIFDPIDPSTPDFFDYDYDVNFSTSGSGGSGLGGSGFGVGTPTPSGILPEQAVSLANTKSRKARLWRKVYYLQYLRELYRRTYADYYNDYYYGIQGSGNLGRLTKKPNDDLRE